MSHQDRMLDQGQIVSLHRSIPRRPGFLLSLFAHLVLLTWIMFRQTPIIYVEPLQQQTMPIISGSVGLSFNPPKSKATPPRASLSYKHRSKQQAKVQDTETATDGTGTQALREHARQATAAIMGSIKFRLTYGFSPNEGDKLPIQTEGKIPIIPATDVPLHFEQYVTVEVTIDVDGRVADARIVAGEVNAEIQQKLLAAIREFRYNPATRNGAPIAFQLDIVVHVPT